MEDRRYKYPRTLHLPNSLGKSNDDKVLTSIDHLLGQEVVITEKCDGENTSIYQDYTHARSIDSRSHPARNWIKSYQASIGQFIPPGYRLCGENMYAKHSIAYDQLESFFLAFSLWDNNNICKDWDTTVDFCNQYGIAIVPILWRGICSEQILFDIAKGLNTEMQEGFVVRKVNQFSYDEFQNNIAKYVRANHVHSDDHWMHQVIVANKLKDM